MSEEKDAFYVVRKGDIVGIYKSWSDVQAELASSSKQVSDGSLKVYKGYSLSQNAEEYLASHGLKEATYSISVNDVNERTLGRVVACPFQQPNCSGEKASDLNSQSEKLRGPFQPATGVYGYSLSKKTEEYLASRGLKEAAYAISVNDVNKGTLGRTVAYPSQAAGSSLLSTTTERHPIQRGAQSDMSTCLSCILEFDGAAKGNPGPAGAGAVLRAEDGSKVCRLREGVGTQTNNVAEYRALILGLKHAIKKGYKHIRVQGDSLLVCNQVKGSWKTKNPNMACLCSEVRELKDKFLSFQINHVLREYNSEADVQANLAVNLKAGQVEEDCK